MKYRFRFCAIVAVLALNMTLAQNAPANVGPSVAIDLNMPQTNVKVGSTIWLDAVTTNLSDKTIAIGFLPGPYDSAVLSLTIQVRDAQQRAVGPEQVDQHSCAGKPHCRVMDLESRYLAPGESVKDHFRLGEQYDFSQPGTYTVEIVRVDKRTKEEIRSNTISINVAR